jgi:hypothetical protein
MAIFLMTTGVICIIVAIVGGGIKLGSAGGWEFKDIPSLWRQLLLATFGGVLFYFGNASAPAPDQIVLPNGSPAHPVVTDANAVMGPVEDAANTTASNVVADQPQNDANASDAANTAATVGNPAGETTQTPMNETAIGKQLDDARWHNKP